MTESTKLYQCAPEVLYQEVNGEIVLLDLDAETYFGLNEPGAIIWQLLQKEKNVEEIVQHLLTEFDAGHEEIESDVYDLLAQLEDAKLILPK